MNDKTTKWILQIYESWDFYNWYYVKKALKRPVIRLSSGSRTLGQWDSEQRTIFITRVHLERDPWHEVMDTLRHEIAHQFVSEVLLVNDEMPHGPAWREACRRLRVSPEAVCSDHRKLLPDEDEEGTHRLLSKFKKLMALSDSPNEHEARAAMAKAREFLTRHNLDELAQGPKHYSIRHLGGIKGRVQSYEYRLASILNDFHFVKVIWADGYDLRRDVKGRVLQIIGTPANLDLAEYVFRYLHDLLPSLWEERKKKRQLKNNRDRLSYYVGVLRGFQSTLERQDARLTESKKALVWKGDSGLREFFHYHYPRTSTIHERGFRITQAYHDGRADGKKVIIRRPIADGDTRFGGYLRV